MYVQRIYNLIKRFSRDKINYENLFFLKLRKYNFILEKKSCLELKLENETLRSGYYLVNIGGEAVSVYCDMVTDGGKVFY